MWQISSWQTKHWLWTAQTNCSCNVLSWVRQIWIPLLQAVCVEDLRPWILFVPRTPGLCCRYGVVDANLGEIAWGALLVFRERLSGALVQL
jgi:hypothetical protein